jgi:hypothetical protein
MALAQFRQQLLERAPARFPHDIPDEQKIQHRERMALAMVERQACGEGLLRIQK